MSIIWITVLVLGITGVIAAIVLWFVAKKFYVYEDPRVAEVEEHLPGANCGSCGYSGCHAFALACVGAESLDGIYCPGAGSEAMGKIATIVGLAAVESVPKVAVVQCGGDCDARPHRAIYDGVSSCAMEASIFSGEGDCVYGCLGCGDCVASCRFGAIHIDENTHLPVVDYSKCVGCGACVGACPRKVMALVEHPAGQPLVWVECNNHDRGPVATKECGVSCIGCTKCKKVCPADAVTMDNFLSRIDTAKCIGCGTCIEACPRKCITSIGELKPILKEENN